MVILKKQTIIPLAVLLSLAAVPRLQFYQLEASLIQPGLAQSAAPKSFPLPSKVADGTKVAINGSSSMETINEALKQSFEKRFAGSNIAIATEGTDAALQSLRDGKIDLAAIGRPLTAAEKAEGLVAVPVSRNKIAVIVGPSSPFKGNLTITQFAKIFRGEITDWSQVGGAKGPIRMVDRPASSDTRQAFLNYPVFQKGKFETGAGATKLTEDRTSAVIQKLGKDGIGYAIADQVVGKPGVHVVTLHKTLPTDSRYPFSQPLSYVYKGPSPSPAVQAFLGYALAPESQRTVEAARSAAMKAPEAPTADKAPAADNAPNATATQPEGSAGTSETSPVTVSPIQVEPKFSLAPLWWLLLPLLGIPLLLWWALGRGGPLAAAKRSSRIILTPRNCRDAYAYWDLSEDDKKEYQRHGKKQALQLYDVTDINLDDQQPHSMQRFEVDDQQQNDLHLPIEVSDRDYLVELGYINTQDDWVKLARSEHVRVPQCSPVETSTMPGAVTTPPVAATGTAAAGTIAAGTAIAGTVAAGAATAGRSVVADDRTSTPVPTYEASDRNRIILTPRNSADAYVYWELPDGQQETLQRQGRNLTLRLYDATDINLDHQDAHALYEFEINDADHDRHLPIRVGDRDYLAEIGYTNEDGHWVSLARSNSTRIASEKTWNRFS